ncbi:hypothetical protein C5B42_04245 [Candidatus Cerribacteria bacterium 'Amazon FNV 2010 28 9']|uniref:Uncharacterized protein n=1 Tax=Candidatus Cerribacteria bacterium 'Amazon FNV 2010 28 9' TaxID=2081795 RepID=A0A317JPK3_9BACT|nr:MAG: hypothetical protein C5B42_04245 [Candidatus Cerribacteria bacterium 'Amazon FNV 2010 28 9']
MSKRAVILLAYLLYFCSVAFVSKLFLPLLVSSASFTAWLTLFFLFAGGMVGILLPKVVIVATQVLSVGSFTMKSVSRFFQLMMKNESSILQSDTTHAASIVYSYPCALVVLIGGFYVISSSTLVFGKAAVLGCALRYVVELLESWQEGTMKQKWLRVFPVNLTTQELHIAVIVLLLAFGVFGIFGLKI